MRLNGIKLLTIALVLVSCCRWSRSELLVSQDLYNYLSVPQDSLFVRYYGDYKFSTDAGRSERRIRKEISRRYHQKGCVVYSAHTIVPPYYAEVLIRGKKPFGKAGLDSFSEQGRPALSYSFAHRSNDYLLAHFYTGPPPDSEIGVSSKKEFAEIYKSIYMGEGYDKQIRIPDFFKEASNAFTGTGLPNYLAPLRQLNHLSQAYKGIDAGGDWMLLQAQLTYHSFLLQGNGTYQNLLNIWRDRTGRISQSDFQNDATIRPLSIESLVNLCRRQQVVFFNENHFMPKHRFLLYWLLDSLRALGFVKLAIEDYTPVSPKTAFPSQQEGFYIKEPVMGEVVRKARALGMEILSYDSTGSSEREELSARRLVDEAFKTDKNARLVVLCGISHLSEEASASKKWMAYYFKKFSGIDPFTIDQTSFENFSEWTPAQTLYAKQTNNGFADLSIINHMNPFETDTWSIDLYKNEKTAAFLKENIDHKLDCSALLYDKEEWESNPEEAVPLRSFYLAYTSGQSAKRISAPAGAYILVVEDVYGNRIEETLNLVP